MDALELAAKRGMEQHFTDLKLRCPSRYCEGQLTEFIQESWTPFKAFLMCPDCESRLRVYKKEK